MTDTDTNTDPILDADFIPVDAGVTFTATYPNPNSTRELTTLADGTLLEIDDYRGKLIHTRERFVNSGSSTQYLLEALRAKMQHTMPTRGELRRLPHFEQYDYFDQLLDHLNTADQMVKGDEVLGDDERAPDDEHGNRCWYIRTASLDAFTLWDLGYTPRWTTSTEPTWSM